jgi:putative PIN family toxin of toxin-antitoxin system
MIRVVFDTNVYLSSMFWSGNPRKCIILAKLNKLQAFSSQPIIEEIRSKLINKFGIAAKESDTIVDDILSYTKVITPKSSFKTVINDPDDNKFIDCAVESKTQFIVSGDRHLLDLKKVRNIRIINPAEFVLLWRFLTK